MTYNSKQNTTEDLVLNGVLKVLDDTDLYVGTMTELKSVLSRKVGKKTSKMLPGSPGALRVTLNRVVNRLRSRGVGVKFGRTTDRTRTRYVKFTLTM